MTIINIKGSVGVLQATLAKINGATAVTWLYRFRPTYCRQLHDAGLRCCSLSQLLRSSMYGKANDKLDALGLED